MAEVDDRRHDRHQCEDGQLPHDLRISDGVDAGDAVSTGGRRARPPADRRDRRGPSTRRDADATAPIEALPGSLRPADARANPIASASPPPIHPARYVAAARAGQLLLGHQPRVDPAQDRAVVGQQLVEARTIGTSPTPSAWSSGPPRSSKCAARWVSNHADGLGAVSQRLHGAPATAFAGLGDEIVVTTDRHDHRCAGETGSSITWQRRPNTSSTSSSVMTSSGRALRDDPRRRASR